MKITFLEKLNPNEKLRNWSQARTFGGTTKTHSLYICGFRRKNFYLLMGGVGFVVLAGSVGGGVGLQGYIKQKTVDNGDLGIIVGKTTTMMNDQGVMTTMVVSETSFVGGPSSPSTTSEVPGQTSAPIPTLTGQDTPTGETPVDPAGPASPPGEETITSSSTSATPTVTEAGSGEGGAAAPDGEYFKGEGTFYAPGLGSCGIESTEAEFVCALSKVLFDADNNGNANNNPNCGRKIFIKNPAGARLRGLKKRERRMRWPFGGVSEAGAREEFGSESIGNRTTLVWVYNKKLRSEEKQKGRVKEGRSIERKISPPARPSTTKGDHYRGKVTSMIKLHLTEVQYLQIQTTRLGATPEQGRTRRKNKIRLHQDSKQKLLPHRLTVEKNGADSLQKNKLLRKRPEDPIQDREAPLPPPPQPPKPIYTHSFTTATSTPIAHLQSDEPPYPQTSPQPTPSPSIPPVARRKRQIGDGGITITVVDRCPACAQYDLDLSPAAYNAIGDVDAGRIEIEWTWLDD